MDAACDCSNCAHGNAECDRLRARVAALESQLAEAQAESSDLKSLLAECFAAMQAQSNCHLCAGESQWQPKDDNLARRIAAALKGTTTCDS